MITNTTYDLQNHLQGIDEKLSILVSLDTEGTRDDPAVREQIQEEKDSILKCLEICDNVSDHIDRLQRSHIVSPTSASSNVTVRPAVSTWLAAAHELAGCKRQLEIHIEGLRKKIKEQSAQPDSEMERDEQQDLAQEIDGLRKSIDICNNAYREADRNRTNVFEDVFMGEDGRQVIASTVGDLIHARKIKIGARSLQMLGQMSDMTIQQATYHRGMESNLSSSDTPVENFEGRYGSGRDLRSQPKSNEK